MWRKEQRSLCCQRSPVTFIGVWKNASSISHTYFISSVALTYMFSPFDDPSGGGGDIWSTGVFAFESPLKDLLDSNDYTLDDLLEQDELLQELRGLHPQLIDYFGAEEAVAGLVRHIVRPPPGVGGSGSDGAVASGDATAAGSVASDAIPIAVANLGRPRSLSEAERKQQEEELLEEAQSALMEAPDIHTLKNRGSTDFGDPDFVADVGDQEEDEDEDGSSDSGDDKDTSQSKPGAGSEDTKKQQQESYWDEAPSPSASPPPTTTSSGGDGNGSGEDGDKEKGSWMFDSTKDDDADIHNKNSKEERTLQETLELLHVRYPYMACEVICCEVAKILDVLVSGSVVLELDTGKGGVVGGHNSQGSLNTVEEEKEADAQQSSRTGDRTLILDLLFGMITSTEALTVDDRRAGYLEKILTVLFRTRPKEVTAYLNDRPHLLRDLINQCHSHSIGQIVQRLMLPPPPGRRASQLTVSGAADAGTSATGASSVENQNGEDDDAPDAEQSQRAFGGSGGWPMISGIDDDDNDLVDNDDDDLLDDEDEEMLTAHGPPGLDRGGWSENVEAVGWLLDRLTGEETSSGNSKGRDRATSDADNYWDDGGGRGGGDSMDDALLDAAQNASEIIVAVVQNSPLTSPIVKSLATEPNLNRLIDAIGAAPGLDGDDDEAINFFPSSESTITLSMSVLESLVLQLGGYGAVSTPIEPEVVNLEEEKEGEGMELVLSAEPTGAESRTLGPGAATTEEVIDHLPKLFSALSALLCHKSTASWTVANQFSGLEARPTLGPARLRIVRLLESLVLLGNETVDALLCKSPALELCLDLFWSFPWCSMLHQSVANLLVHVLEGGPERVDLQRYFINRCGLVRRLMESFDNVGPSPESTDPSAEAVLSQEASGGDGDAAASEGPNQPRYSEVMFALKEISDKQEHASSVDSERGSDVSEDDEVLAISEDDVEAAIEQQMLKVRDMEVASSTAVAPNVDAPPKSTDDEKAAGTSSTAVISSSTSPSAAASPSPTRHGEFRMGYMGHVIIVCQALVHACSVGLMDGGEMGNCSNDNDGRSDADSFDAEIDTVLPKVNGDFVASSSLEQALKQDAEANVIARIPNIDLSEESEGETDAESRKRKGRSFDSESSEAVKSSKQSSSDGSPKMDTSESSNQEQSIAIEGTTHSNDNAPGNFPTDPSQIQHPSECDPDRPPIFDIMMSYPLYDAWQSFVTTILASETAIQSTPLGGFAVTHPQEQMTSVNDPGHEHRVSLTEEDLKNFMGMNVEEEDEEGGMGTVAGSNGVPIDLDDADLDIAASMMEALSMPQGANVVSTSGVEDESGPPGHHRRNQVMAGFGAIVQAAPAAGGSKYIYDDPLGGGNDFDDDSSDEDEGAKDEKEDGDDTEGGSGATGDDEDVPVLDLFAGNWEDAASSNDTDDTDEQDGGWANFDDADAFAAAGLPEPTPLAPDVSGTTSQPPDDSGVADDVFASSPHLVDTLADDDEDDDDKKTKDY